PAACRQLGPPVGQNDGTRGLRGDAAGKQGNGRKRQLLVTTLGVPLLGVVHAARVHDRDGATMVLEQGKGRRRSLRLIGADGGDAGQWVLGHDRRWLGP
ncbi:transposase, partial [Chloroflexus sp.]|uniref:transposase n=1 Tax=Chloroflexus sp. TaxID=1904827 RepID=UPI0040496519